MTPEQKAKAYAERTYMYGIQRAIAKSAHLAGQQAALAWIPVTLETMPEEYVPLQFYSYNRGIYYGKFDGHKFYDEVYDCYRYEVTHFRYIPQDKPGEK